MKQKKIVLGDFQDPETGLRFVEDDRGVYHLIRTENSSTITDSEVKRLIRIMEALRVENNWLWGVIETARHNYRTRSGGYAMKILDKTIKERQR